MTGVHRQLISIKRLSLTDFKVHLDSRSPRPGTLAKKMKDAQIVDKFKASSWGQKLEKQKAKLALTDFDRFKGMIAHKKVKQFTAFKSGRFDHFGERTEPRSWASQRAIEEKRTLPDCILSFFVCILSSGLGSRKLLLSQLTITSGLCTARKRLLRSLSCLSDQDRTSTDPSPCCTGVISLCHFSRLTPLMLRDSNAGQSRLVEGARADLSSVPRERWE